MYGGESEDGSASHPIFRHKRGSDGMKNLFRVAQLIFQLISAALLDKRYTYSLEATGY